MWVEKTIHETKDFTFFCTLYPTPSSSILGCRTQPDFQLTLGQHYITTKGKTFLLLFTHFTAITVKNKFSSAHEKKIFALLCLSVYAAAIIIKKQKRLTEEEEEVTLREEEKKLTNCPERNGFDAFSEYKKMRILNYKIPFTPSDYGAIHFIGPR